MNPENREPMANAQGSQWPACSIWAWGTFGTKSPAERRYIMRTYYAFAVAASWILIAFNLHFRPKPVILPLTALVTGAVITWIAWEKRRYLLQLDELARRMQLEPSLAPISPALCWRCGWGYWRRCSRDSRTSHSATACC